MKHSKKLILTLLAIFIISLTLQTAVSQITGIETITATELKAHLNFIASDELEGRETTHRGMKLAARYIASYLDAYDYKPIGDNGTYYQNFEVDVTKIPADVELVVESGYTRETLKNGEDFIIAQAPAQSTTIEASVVFAGYGISKPDLGWDDYENLEVKDKFVVFLMDNPEGKDEFSGINENVKIQTALSKGAAGVILILSNQLNAQWDMISKSFAGQEQMALAGQGQQGGILLIGIPHKSVKKLLNLGDYEFNQYKKAFENRDKVEPKEYDNVTASITVEMIKETRTTQNVVGLLEGSDPVLKNEYIAMSAHYDHLGVSNGDIYNGADDDGSGTVALIELAEAFSLHKPPKRSILFIFHTAEEKGLLGARYFTENPLVPIENMSCLLNMDMISRNEHNSIYIIGSDKLSSELHELNEQVNKKEIGLVLDYKYNAPDDPERFYYRSDHYMYAQYGIPVIFYFSGTHEDYHRPTDTVEKCDFAKMEKVTQLVYGVAREAANLDHMLVLDKDVKYRGKPKLTDEKGREYIDKEDLVAHLSFIASDELEGRDTGSRGLKIAARYIASYLKSFGFKPLDKEKSYFQKFNLAVDKLAKDSKIVVSKYGTEKELTAYKDFITTGDFPEKIEEQGGVVFAGYGIYYPELEWNDFEGLDIDGKFVVMASGIPAYRDSIFAKREYARKISGQRMSYLRGHNVKGILYVPGQRLLGFWDRLASRERMKLTYEEESFTRYIPTFYVKPETVGDILGLSEYREGELLQSFKNGEKLETFEYENATITLDITREREYRETQNVVGVLEGSDPNLRDEYVAFGAHYDHVGIRDGVVYNGADDDGTGTVALIEMAEAYANGDRPKRSILMVFHTGEEKGLLGSRYFSDHSLVPLEKIDCMLNIDMIGRRGTDSLFIIGADRLSTELDKINRAVNEEKTKMIFDYTYNEPNDPQRFYYRSDHYMYARYGIPIIFYFCGTTEHYHQPTDDVETINFEKFLNVTKHIYSVGFKVANLDHMLEVDKGPKKRGKRKEEER